MLDKGLSYRSGPLSRKRKTGALAPHRDSRGIIERSCAQMEQDTFKGPFPEDCQGSGAALSEQRHRHTSFGGSPLVFILLEGAQDF